MKKIIVTLTAILAAGLILSVSAQDQRGSRRPDGNRPDRQKPDMEQIMKDNAKKVSETLALDDKNASRFIPLHIEYSKAMMDLHREYRGERPHGNERMTDAEVDARIRRNFDKSRKIIDLREAYYARFLEILTPRQIQKMYDSEKQMGAMASHAHDARHPEGGRPRDGRRF